MQRTLAQQLHAALELGRLAEPGFLGTRRQKLDLDQRGQRGGAALPGRKLGELLVEVLRGEVEFGLGHRLAVDGRDHRVVLGERRTGEGNAERERGGKPHQRGRTGGKGHRVYSGQFLGMPCKSAQCGGNARLAG